MTRKSSKIFKNIWKNKKQSGKKRETINLESLTLTLNLTQISQQELQKAGGAGGEQMKWRSKTLNSQATEFPRNDEFPD